MAEVLRLSAFADSPDGGNPAGVVLDASALTAEEMQGIASDIGYAETAFVTDYSQADQPRLATLKYFSPIAEVPFCGHATVAAAVALSQADGPGSFIFQTRAGAVTLETAEGPDGIVASFTSVEPSVQLLPEADLDAILELLALQRSDLSAAYPPRISLAGNQHPVLVLSDAEVFDRFRFEPLPMRKLMDRKGWTGTVTILLPRSANEFEARNLFPVGAIVEDPATGSAAASVGAYIRALGTLPVPAELVIRQGRHIGRPSVLNVFVPEAGGITVSGTAIRIAE